MKNLTWILILPLLAGLSFTAACGETVVDEPDAGTDAGTPLCDAEVSATVIDVEGTASVHPVSMAMAAGAGVTITMADLSMTLEDPVQVLAGRDAALQHPDCSFATIDLTPNTGAETTADYAFTTVDTAPLALGLVATFDNINGGTAFVKTTMGLASGPQTANLVVATPSFAISAMTEGALSQLDGKAPGALQTAGWIFGMFITPAGVPIDGVELVDANGAAITPVLYPNATFTGVETDGNTSANGVFVISGVGLQEYGGNDTIGTTTCQTQQAATNPDSAFVVVLACM